MAIGHLIGRLSFRVMRWRLFDSGRTLRGHRIIHSQEKCLSCCEHFRRQLYILCFMVSWFPELKTYRQEHARDRSSQN